MFDFRKCVFLLQIAVFYWMAKLHACILGKRNDCYWKATGAWEEPAFGCSWKVRETTKLLYRTFAVSFMAQGMAMFVILVLWLVHHLCFRLKYLNNYCMDCHEIVFRHLWPPEDKTK